VDKGDIKGAVTGNVRNVAEFVTSGEGASGLVLPMVLRDN